MDIKAKIKQLITVLLYNIKERKKMILALSCLVVFFTTYLLILPAFTLDKEEATEQGGIDVPGVELSADADETSNEPASGEAEEPVSKNSAESAKTEAEKTDVKKKSADVTLENKESDDFSVAVESKDDVLSEDMSVAVREIDQSDKEQKEEYESLYNDALEAVQKVEKKEGLEKPSDFAFAKFYDISLKDGDDEVEPESAVDVKISFSKDLQKELKVTDTKRVHIVHFAVDKESGEVTPEVLDADTTDIKVKNNKVTEANFTADSFSVFAVVYSTLEKTYISASGDTYDIKVTYDETAEIPEDAELSVREIKSTEEEFTKNVEATNKKLNKQGAPEVDNPVQFDIKIVSSGVEIEPKEGSTVNVEVQLMPEVFGEQTEDNDNSDDSVNTETEEGGIWFNGVNYEGASGDEPAHYTVSHITDNGTAEVIEDVSCSENEDGKIVLQFETDSFSDYLFDTSNTNTLWNLPDTIYVGDEIYMYSHAEYYVTNIGTIVSETKHPNGQPGNDGSSWKTVIATNPGKFRIVHRNDWNNGNPYQNYKEITVLPARTGTTHPPTIETIDNAKIGLTLNLFDYDLDGYLDDYFNNYDHGDNPVSSNFLDRSNSINNGHDLKFWGSGIGNQHGSYNQFVEHGVTSIVSNQTRNGYPVLKHNNTSLDYLFTPSDGTDKKAYTNVNGLFKKEGDYYVYDSNVNYAYYDVTQGNEGRFEVYNGTYNQKSGGEGGSEQDKAIGFFPFHKYDSGYDRYVKWNKNLNHHFGLSMSVNFSLPKEPKAVKDASNKDIIFEFSGDDDLWVFIDGKLAMDIGGVHQPTNGTINFTTKQVVVNGNTQSFDFSGLYDGKDHTLQVFYIERGGCDSNCKIKFNMTRYGDVEFDKVDEEDQSTLLPGATFGLYRDRACTTPLMEYLNNNTSRAFIAEADTNGHVKFDGVPIGNYYLKELSAPEGYPVDPAVHDVEVYVDSSGIIKVKVKIDGEDVESGVKITNKKPTPISLGLVKVWQNMDGHSISVLPDTKATFEIKRIRTYETIIQEELDPGHGEQSSKLTVGWIHNGEIHKYKEYNLISGSLATVSWRYANDYDGDVGCVENGTTITKTPNPNNSYSEGLTMPAAGGEATLYIIDNSEAGEAVVNINVAGSEFIGNNGGGIIHHFETTSEPDPDFQYTGDDNVTNNQVTLPIDGLWEYSFNNLPLIGNDANHVYNYSYYLEEVSTENPSGATVIYKDTQGNIINTPTAAETTLNGTQTITNKIPTGFLKVEKKVTYNNHAPENSQQASVLAGTYTFTVYSDEECQTPYKKNGQDVTIPITIGTDGAAVRSEPIELPVGNYWLKETDSTNQDMYPVGDNKLPVTITADDTSSDPVIKSLTNNYDENDGPDKIVLDIEKKFSGLISTDHIPQDFKVYLKYKLNNQDVVLELRKDPLDTQHDNHIKWSSEEDFVWHWRISNIDPEATDFMIKETNYDNAEGYSFDWAKLDTVDITNYPPSNYHNMNVAAPTATLDEVTENRVEPDNDKNYTVFENDVILVSLTGNHGQHGTLVVSQESLNKLERDSIEKKVPGLQGSWKKPCYFFSIQEHPEGFYYKGNTVTFTWDATRECYIVHVEHPQPSMEEVFMVSYNGHSELNNAMYENHYVEVPVSVDIVKVDQNNRTIKLGGAYFRLRQIEDAAPTPQGTFDSLDGGINVEIGPTDETTGIVTHSGLTHGYYELTETSAPDGYIMKDDLKVYFKVDAGKITWLEPGSGAPSTWEKKTTSDEIVTFHAATATSNASFEVGNTPGAELPHTGGIGTAVFYILGSILIAASGMMLWRRRKTI